MTKKKSSVLKSLGCIAAGAGLSVAFPAHSETQVAWLAFIPLLIMLRFSTPRQGFGHGFLFGLGFWLISIFWLMELRNNSGPVLLVTFGLVGLSVWCSLFSAFFGMAVGFLWRGGDSATEGWRRYWFETWRPVAVASLWCGGEYLRSTLFTGFAWNAVGVSQISFLKIAQVASLGGVYAVSFVVLLCNAAFANVCVRLWRNTMLREPNSTRRHPDLMLALLVLMAAIAWGNSRMITLINAQVSAEILSIAAIDPDLPCIFMNEDEEANKRAYNNLFMNSHKMVSKESDLIVWPETSLYSSMPNPYMEEEMLDFASYIGIPILAGTTEIATNAVGTEIYRNSTFLFGTNWAVEASYSKQHLVPFGEYIPFDKTFKFLQKIAPTGVSCTPGEGPVVMEVGGVRVSPLICFEDTVAPLSRAAVNAGAQILIVQSNDAWFYGSSEAEQHNAQAVFRAIENAVPIVRSSNRGLTSAITPYGSFITAVKAIYGENQMFLQQRIPVSKHTGKTLYSRFGDWIFGIPCAVFFCIAVIASFKWERVKVAGQKEFSNDIYEQ